MISEKLPDSPQPGAGERRTKWAAARLVLWCLVCLTAPLVILRTAPLPPPDDQSKDRENIPKRMAQLRTAQPEYIGIGNSMMFTRIGKDPRDLSALTGKKFHFLYRGGSDSPVWYLLLKNVVVASGVRPKAILLFVRDNELTTPYFGTDAKTSPYLASLRTAQEPELDRYLHSSASPSAGEVNPWLEDLYSFPEWQEHLSRQLADIAMDVGGLGAPKKAQRFAMSARFDLDHLRGDIPADLPKADGLTLMTGSYEAATESSLLPAMVRLADGIGAKLLVFRVKRRPDAQTNLPEEPAAMREYSAFLSEWMKARGGAFYDETYDTSIRLSDYLDGDHIRPERLEWYRAYFWKRMGGIFP